MNSKNKPSIYTIQGLRELVEWEEGGFALDFNSVDDHPEFEDLVAQVSVEQQLTSDGIKQYGIPYNVEGYGFIVNTEYLKSLFDNPADTLVDDLKTSTYSEFEAFVLKVQDFASGVGGGSSVTLSGHTYKLANSAPSQLDGVFSVMGAEKWSYGDHSVNIAVATAYKTPAEAANVSNIDGLQKQLEAYAKLLDLKSSNLGMSGTKRGAEFVTQAKGGYNTGIAEFTNGSALLLKQGNWSYGDIESIDAEYAQDLDFIPVKLDITDSDVTRDDIDTADEFNSRISVFNGQYYAINNKIDKETQKLAMDFLVWLNTSETGRNIVINEFNFVPFNADENTVVPNSLGNAILDYVNSGNTIGAPYLGAPATWPGDNVGKYVMENYMNKSTAWTQADYTAIADYAQERWVALKA